MAGISAAASGTFRIGGETPVTRLGFGAMRITGQGIWGPPADRDEAIRTLKRLPELGVDFIDTANSYGPDVSEELIREALHPYRRPGHRHQGRAHPQRAERLDPEGRPRLSDRRGRAQPREARRRADRPLAAAPDRRQGAARRAVRRGPPAARRGVIRYAGLSEVSVEEIEAARRVFPVATVQNRYNLDRPQQRRRARLSAQAEGIGFMPWAPLSGGALARPGSLLDEHRQRGTAPRRARSRSPGC